MSYVVSLYAKGQRIASDCLPEFYPTRAAAYEAGASEVARVVSMDPADRDPQFDWARRFTIRRVTP